MDRRQASLWALALASLLLLAAAPCQAAAASDDEPEVPTPAAEAPPVPRVAIEHAGPPRAPALPQAPPQAPQLELPHALPQVPLLRQPLLLMVLPQAPLPAAAAAAAAPPLLRNRRLLREAYGGPRMGSTASMIAANNAKASIQAAVDDGSPAAVYAATRSGQVNAAMATYRPDWVANNIPYNYNYMY